MKKNELAAKLGGMDIDDIPGELDREAKRAGLVVVLGASRDMIEFRGAIHDKIDIPGGGVIYFDANGVLDDVDDVPEAERQGYYDRKRFAYTIDAAWEQDGFKWAFTMPVPHSRFVVNRDGARYCRAIVFSLVDCGIVR